MTQILKDALQDLYIPPKPELLGKIKAVSYDMSLVAAILEDEPFLVAKLLQLINSPFYGLKKKITSLKHICLMFGYEQIETLIKCELMKKAFHEEGKASEIEKFWNLAKQTGFCAKLLSIKLKLATPDMCFTLGLFHNTGGLIFLKPMPEYFDMVNKSSIFANSKLVSMSKFEHEFLGMDHATLSHKLAESWSFPLVLQSIIKIHHDEEAILFTSGEYTVENDMLAILKLADHFATLFTDSTRLDAEYEWSIIKTPLLNYLGLGDGGYEDLKDYILEMMLDAFNAKN